MKKLTDKDPMPFGKYKGVIIAKVPDDYLLWLWNKGVEGPMKVHIKENLEAIKTNIHNKR